MFYKKKYLIFAKVELYEIKFFRGKQIMKSDDSNRIRFFLNVVSTEKTVRKKSAEVTFTKKSDWKWFFQVKNW